MENKNIIKALVKFQGLVKDPAKDANNPHFKSKYVPLDSLIKAVRPTLAECGLAVVMTPITDGERVGIEAMLIHESGETMQFPPFTFLLQKKDAQGAGSAITYARRYAMSAILGLAWDDDDDANSACNHEQTQGKQAQQTKQTQQAKQATRPRTRKDEIASALNEIVAEKKIDNKGIATIIIEEFDKACFKDLSESEAIQLLAYVKRATNVKDNEQ